MVTWPFIVVVKEKSDSDAENKRFRLFTVSLLGPLPKSC
jgi:hypothetical protein